MESDEDVNVLTDRTNNIKNGNYLFNFSCLFVQVKPSLLFKCNYSSILSN